ncbi:hypothetical protein Hz2V031 [Helicoverpa zea nudivirus 2]|uniref:Uncharacterized protein n=1 Tax=Helicoverpa zea nudivirus 2 TaxID=1128424 RepID=G9I057_HZNV2|nr:orf31 gene product [Helicoverpa zea nudivirus 2]AEW69580.1 hypothetical protein Hz2V031 [Helicoverpa zea nudivirus 2]WCZ68511.1 hypothetical protein HvNV031 [Heliothis virescens nudivirus]
MYKDNKYGNSGYKGSYNSYNTGSSSGSSGYGGSSGSGSGAFYKSGITLTNSNGGNGSSNGSSGTAFKSYSSATNGYSATPSVQQVQHTVQKPATRSVETQTYTRDYTENKYHHKMNFWHHKPSSGGSSWRK